MSTWIFLRQSLLFYWRTHLGVTLGAALGAMVITGALLVGDSVKATLRKQALERVGKAQSAMLSSDRFFSATPAGTPAGSGDLAAALHGAPVLLINGSVSRADGAARVNQAQVLGVDDRFWSLAPQAVSPDLGSKLGLNSRAAAQLGVKVGDTLILRVEKPSAFSRDAPLSGEENAVVAIRSQVGAILSDEQYGRFGLQASQIPPFTVFASLADLQNRLEEKGRANLLLSSDAGVADLQSKANAAWRLDDAGLELRPLKDQEMELRTSRVFLDPAVSNAAPGGGLGALTYFVNELRSGVRATPYSMVTAVDDGSGEFNAPLMADDEILVSQWLADDLSVSKGAKITLKYFVMGERRQLTEKSQDFTVRAVLPMNDVRLDPSWMPDFPGLADKKNCRDWQPGFGFDSTRIRDKDQKYWEDYRGTPKAFVNLRAGQRMWSNRWGNLTSIRWAGQVNTKGIELDLRRKLTLDQLGFQFLPLREQALAATDAPVDFGQLFIGFSFFLLAAAAVLTGLLFVFSLEQRNREAGLLLALGLRPRQVRRLFLAEGMTLSVVGSVLGLVGAIVYTKIVLRALDTVWQGAVGSVKFVFAAEPLTLVTGGISGVLVAVIAMWLASRRQLKHSARELLTATGGLEMARADLVRGRSWSLWVAVICLVSAVGWLAFDKTGTPDTFFSAASLLLIAGLAFGLAWLRHEARTETGMTSLVQFGHRNAARRRGRSVATAAVLASGVFIVVAVDAFRQSPGEGAGQRLSGTGGFALVGESSLPIYEDLNSPAGRDAFAFDDQALQGVDFVPLRVRTGDDASCLNLNRALQPRLFAVNPEELAKRGAFNFSAAIQNVPAMPESGWKLLDKPPENGALPAITDDATLQWALQKKLGDTIDYQDERGQTFKVQIVATLAESMLQGNVIISEKNFIERFPNQGGYRFFLIDAPAEKTGEIAKTLSRGLADRGFEITPAPARLGEFQAVVNTYLSIFEALGGLGLLLGSLGLAIVVARNVLERRSEFGLLEAVGFRPGQLRKLVFAEHRWLIICGLLIGVISAVVAVWPNLHKHANGFPMAEMSLLLAALALGALFWTWLATRLALRGHRIEALRNE